MLSYEQVLDLMTRMEQSPLTMVELVYGEFRVSIKREYPPSAFTTAGVHAPVQAGVAAVSSTETNQSVLVSEVTSLIEVTSPMVGTFYAAPKPDADPFVSPGARVVPGDTLCIIEAMKLMNELPAEISGEVVEICVRNGQAVEFGQVLFRLRSD